MDEHVQKAVDCYNAGATVLHVHVRELDGHGSKRLSMFNELLARLRVAVPDMILQVGGSISFAPEGEGEIAKWLSDDTRHMLAELEPAPDQVTIAINTNQMNIVEQMCEADLAGTSLARAGRLPRVPRDDHSRGSRVGGRAHPAADDQWHPDALPARQHRTARDRRAHDAQRHVQRAADPHLGCDRRRLRSAEHLQPGEFRARRARRRGADRSRPRC